MKRKKEIIAFVTPEVFVTAGVHTGSGGLGEFSRAILTAAYKKGIQMIGFTILPREGYYDQGLDLERGMTVSYVPRHYPDIFENTGIYLKIQLCGEPVTVLVHRLPRGKFGFAETYFFDTDIPENSYLGRLNTLGLYGGGHVDRNGDDDERKGLLERKICQSLLIGKATIALIEHFGFTIDIIHINESHCAFTAVELLYQYERIGKRDPLKAVRKKVRFTTHTPIDAGNPVYPLERLACLSGYSRDMLRKIGGDNEAFPMTGAGIYLAGLSNAVSKKHLKTAQVLFGRYAERKLISITNGASLDFWQHEDFQAAKNLHDFIQAKKKHRRALIDYMRTYFGIFLDEEKMIIVWARRFTGYKRPDLILNDTEWAKTMLESSQGFQLIYAGKPHPDEKRMVELWNDIYYKSKNGAFPDLFIIPGFDMEMNRILKGGADVWLNTPRAPYEACGTSGMSAAMVGAMNCSTPDGWILEANPDNAFLFGSNGVHDMDQDEYDASELRKCIGKRIIPAFYGDKFHWYSKAFSAKKEMERDHTADGMLEEYCERMYR